MPSPNNSSSTSFIQVSSNIIIDALLYGEKWGSSYGGYTTLKISYSFPWVNSSTAVFVGPDGRDYSSNGEQNATYRFGLNSTQQVAANLALAAWSNVANINFQFLQETSTNVGDIRFAFTSASSISDAWGYAWTPDDYWPAAGDIWINADYGNDEDWSVGSHNYQSLIHEIGHALGLKHPFTGNVKLDADVDNLINTILSYTAKDNLYIDIVNIETPMVFDIAAIQYMYGANNNYNVGNDVYSFEPNIPFYKTIWDAGGNDTVSASNFSLDCIIDLTPGSYSSLRYQPLSIYSTYEGNNNLGIAFNCIIENAIGGSGHDILVGNFANNNLDGGAGNDIMYGGDGNDTFDWDADSRYGNDTMYGGFGDDTYVLNSSSDNVIEFLNEGLDIIWTNFNYSLESATNVEALYLFGSSDINVSGNDLSNFLRGNYGNNFHIGNGGLDTFIFNANRNGVDTISDISVGEIITIIGANFSGPAIEGNGSSASLNQIQIQRSGGITTLNIGTDSNVGSDIEILLTGSYSTNQFLLSGQNITFIANRNSIPTGVVSISGVASQGQVLTASNTLADIDGLGVITYQWRSNGSNINGATGSSLTLTQAEVGKAITVLASYTDRLGSAESVVSGASQQVVELFNENSSSTLPGGRSNDTFISGLANDFIIGGGGLDYVSFSGNARQYIFALTPEGSLAIRDSVANRNGTDLLTGVERLQFSDTNVALDIAGTAGQAYRIYEAVLGRAPDLEGLGYWINDMDNGVSLTTIAQGFIASPEFQGKYGANPSYETYINLLYNNILERDPDIEGMNYWVSNMRNGIDSPAAVLASFSEGYENTANVAPDIANGIYYTAWIT